ncbi:MAG TPA: EF-hand domain-containing protein [Rhizomicrobium sp.]|jgi:Ca2+-binding EF-hand superfamily protein
MKNSIRYGLLIGAAIVAGAGAALAAMQAQHPPSYAQHPQGRGHGRGPGRFFAEYDLNRDGKVTRDEVNKVVAQRFAQATSGAKAMNQQQLADSRTRSARQHIEDAFRRSDWNGDGKLTFDEYANPIRARFARADKQAAGFILCRPPANGANAAKGGSPRGHGRSGRGSGSFCPRDDLNHDGKVTRAELDKALAQQFGAGAKGGASLTKDQYMATAATHSRATSGHMFQRMDQNHDGTVTLAEFGASQQRMFERMDANHDGAITRDELAASHSRSSYRRPPGKG